MIAANRSGKPIRSLDFRNRARYPARLQRTERTLHHAPAPTSKERNAVQREVTRLLDDLAPERTSPRATKPVAEIQQHRSPNGCILQSESAALSVTWYAEADDQDRVGELQVILWRGVVSRRGGAKTSTPAEVVKQEVLNPIEHPADESVWASRTGAVYSTEALAAHCRALLEEQMQEVKA